jgi:hypothetical protein
MSNASFLLFMHIPKNAGTTFRSIVDCQYGEDAVLTYYNQPNTQLLDNLPYMLVRPNPYRALIGHFRFGPHRGMPGRPRYLTLLRDPVRRAISEYNERLAQADTRAELTKPDGSVMSLAEALDYAPYHYTNQQVKYVAGLKPGTEASARDAEQALAHIERHFDFAGTVERFDESILLMGQALGWRPFVYDRLNARPSPLDHPPDVLARLTEMTKFDQILYDRVAERLERTIAQAGSALDDAVQELRTFLDSYQTGTNEHPREAILSPGELPTVAQFLSVARAEAS